MTSRECSRRTGSMVGCKDPEADSGYGATHADEVQGKEYRPDIDGLRAISIVSVLAFHAGFPFISGGFIGVDVFFVISGYLISKLLIEEFNEKQSINLLNFLARRVRRLAPALLLVVVTVLVFSAFLLERISGEVGALARAAVATLFVNANHFFLYENGDYFGALAETNPLLHMWSLAVEEQFYFVWPLVLILGLKRWGFSGVRYITIFIFILSLIYCCYLTFANVSAAFYLMPSRSWELMSGALLAFAFIKNNVKIKQQTANWMAVSGLTIVAVSVTFLSEQWAFPGPSAALPVTGALLLLAANNRKKGTCTSSFLASQALVYIGKISYPLYLWHWPVLVLMRSHRLYKESIWLDLLGLIISFILAALTFELVEKNLGDLLKY